MVGYSVSFVRANWSNRSSLVYLEELETTERVGGDFEN